MIWTIIGLLIVLGIVVVAHEFGHYFAARICGVRAENFSIGFGRPIIKWTDKRGTEWRIGWIPLGGYCTPYGQEMMFNRKRYADLPAENRRGHYLSVSAWKQALIIAGGVILNFALAFIIYWGLAARPHTVQLPVVGLVANESAAASAGVIAGDAIVRINGKKVASWDDVIIAKELAIGKTSDVVLIRGQGLISVKIASAESWGLIADENMVQVQRRGIGGAFVAGAQETWRQSKMLVVILKQIITGDRSTKQLGSFITIAQVSGQALAAGLVALLAIIALLSVNLAVINLLPLPVLDGGYLLILAVEGIIRRKLQGRAMEYVLWVGWIIIGLLFALTMKNDIFRVLGWQ